MSRGSTALRWTGYVAVAIVFAIICVLLSNWQFARNDARSRQLALVEANYDAPVVAVADLIPAGADLDPQDEWRPVSLTGHYLAEEQLLVRNRPHGGTSAFEILVPFALDDGRSILVNRGWVLPGNRQADPDEIPAPPSGEVTVVARLKPGEPLPSSGRSAPDGQVPTINLPLVASAADAGELELSAYAIMVSEEPSPATLPGRLESPSADPGPHLSYAIQWILFAIMGFIFIGYIIRAERRIRREDAEDAADEAAAATAGTQEAVAATASAPRRRRRQPKPRDRDMVDEDTLLDRVEL